MKRRARCVLYCPSDVLALGSVLVLPPPLAMVCSTDRTDHAPPYHQSCSLLVEEELDVEELVVALWKNTLGLSVGAPDPRPRMMRTNCCVPTLHLERGPLPEHYTGVRRRLAQPNPTQPKLNPT